MELEDYRKQMNDLKNEESKIASKMYALKKKYIGGDFLLRWVIRLKLRVMVLVGL